MDPINRIPNLVKALPIEPLFDAVPPEKRRLGLFLLIAGLAHLIAFNLIRINYPQPAIHNTSHVHVTLAEAASTSLTAANRGSLRFWYALQDPSMLIRLRDPLVDTAKIEMSPLGVAGETKPNTTTALRNDKIAFLPDGLPALNDRAATMIEAPHQTFTYPNLPASANKTAPSEVTFDPTLASRVIVPAPTLPRQSSSLLTEAGVTTLRLGVDRNGHVAHALIDQSCGKASVDAVALQALRKTRFEAAPDQDLVWGQVTVYWQFEPETTTPAPTTAPTPGTP